MIVGTMETAEQGYVEYPPILREALAFLRAHDFKKMADGHYPIRGEQCFANLDRYTTRAADACFPETHQRFVDIQYLVEGEEYLGWCPLSPELSVRTPYDAARDVTFYERLVPESNLVLLPGSFAVLFPEDVHRPQVATEDGPAPVTKVVVKISTELL